MGRADELAEIEDGDSNEVCLAKTMIAIQSHLDSGKCDDGECPLSDLAEAGETYAVEVLDARE